MTGKYFCAVDIGGTKSEAVIFDRSGRIISERRTKGITPVDAPFDECLSHYKKTLSDIISDAPGAVAATYCSVATVEHYSPAVYDLLKTVPGTGMLRVEPDGLCLISSVLGHADGASMICGTGSSLYVRHGESFYRVGGWGHFIDSCGSGFVLGRLAFRAALRAFDGRDGGRCAVRLGVAAPGGEHAPQRDAPPGGRGRDGLARPHEAANPFAGQSNLLSVRYVCKEKDRR